MGLSNWYKKSIAKKTDDCNEFSSSVYHILIEKIDENKNLIEKNDEKMSAAIFSGGHGSTEMDTFCL